MKLDVVYLGDCLDVMCNIDDASVDMILCDLPYGTTSCTWDTIIDFDRLWEQYERVIRPQTAICLFGTEPFSTLLRMSKLEWYKYDWVWHKSKSGSAFTAKYRPLQKHEIISVFGRGRVNYYPILLPGAPYYRKRAPNLGDKPNYHRLGVISESETRNRGFRYPETVIFFQQKWRRQDQLHPTQKPVELCEYLIKTYTREGELVLDNACGSGTTGVACIRSNRRYILIDNDARYVEISRQRIKNE